MKRVVVLLTLLTCTSCLHAALAVATYSFDRITYNLVDCTDAEVGEGQFFVDVYENGLLQDPDNPLQNLTIVAFNLRNDGPVPSVISEIYFDGELLALRTAIDDSLSGVDFKDDYSGNNKVNPHDLPGGNVVGFNADTAFSVEAESPEPDNGVGPGQWVRIEYALDYGMNYQDVLNQLNDGSLLIGIHVKAIDCEPADADADSLSESFVSVPEPAALVLLGLGGVWLRRRK